MRNFIEEVESYYNEWQQGEDGEGVFFAINEILKIHPEAIDFFITKFLRETNNSDKETLAEIILRQQPYQPAIDFLKQEMGWDDFTGFAGFPDS